MIDDRGRCVKRSGYAMFAIQDGQGIIQWR
jgi:hypothetical protein